VYGGAGTDNLYFVKTTHMVQLNGDEGTDFISGGSAGDIIDGGSEADYIWGFGGGDTIGGGSGDDDIYAGYGIDIVAGNDGNDLIFGDAGNDTIRGDGVGATGNDTIYGGDGNDVIDGGKGQDTLSGNAGHDDFIFFSLDSDPKKPDHITDFAATARWIGTYDRIDTQGPAGTATNYFELSIGYNDGFTEAKAFAQAYIGGATRYVFVTDDVNGYFFSDVNGNGTMDNAIVLEGLGGLSDFSYKNVVDL
jgi:Ca2+-binding RTX toxin-like protein